MWFIGSCSSHRWNGPSRLPGCLPGAARRLRWGPPWSAAVDLLDLDVAAVAVAHTDDLETAAAHVGDQVLLALGVDDRADLVNVDVLGVGDPTHACSSRVTGTGWTTGPPASSGRGTGSPQRCTYETCSGGNRPQPVSCGKAERVRCLLREHELPFQAYG